MPDTVVGLFRTRGEAQAAVESLHRAGFDSGQVSLATPARGRREHHGLKLLARLVIGVVAGAIAGAIASGMVAGLLISMAASGDRALHYEQEVESGRFLVSVAGDRLELDGALGVLTGAGALEAAPVEAPIDPVSRPRPEGGWPKRSAHSETGPGKTGRAAHAETPRARQRDRCRLVVRL